MPNYGEDTGTGTPFGTIIQDTFVAPASGTLVISYAPHTGDAYHQYNLQISVVPEPASIGLLAVGGVGLLVDAGDLNVGRKRIRSIEHLRLARRRLF